MGLVERSRCFYLYSFNISDRLNQIHAARGLSHCAIDFWMAGVTNHHNFPSFTAHLGDAAMDLGDQRTSRIKHAQAAFGGPGYHHSGRFVRGIHHHIAGRDLVQFFDENDIFLRELLVT